MAADKLTRKQARVSSAIPLRVHPVSYDEWLGAPFADRFVRDIPGQPRSFYLRVTPTKPKVQK